MLRRFFLALVLLAAGAARGDVYVFQRLALAHGYQGPLVVDVEWADGSSRPVSAVTGTLTVWSTAPRGGAGGTVLFTASLTPAGMPVNRLVATLGTSATALPGTYYAEITLTEGAVVDVLHGAVTVEGR
jgi:hypothetical protein